MFDNYVLDLVSPLANGGGIFINGLQSQVDVNSANINTNSSAIAENTSEIDSLVSSVNSNSLSISILITEVDDMQFDIENQLVLINNNAASITTNTASIVSINSTISIMQTDIAENSAEIIAVAAITDASIGALSKRDGVQLYIAGKLFPVMYSTKDLNNITDQPLTSSTVTTSVSGTPVGNYTSYNFQNLDQGWYVHPGFGIIGYGLVNYASTIKINYENSNPYPVLVRGNPIGQTSSVRIYYDGNESIRPPII